MQRLSTADRIRVVSALVEGNSIASTTRMTGVAKTTILRLLADMGRVCAEHHDRTVQGIYPTRVQMDEVWAFVACKDKNVPAERRNDPTVGSVWTFKALDADSKLVISYRVGGRDIGTAYEICDDLASRLGGRVQLTTDGFRPYAAAVWEAFGIDVDYAQLVKTYEANPESDTRYSPPKCVKCEKRKVIGKPDAADISTSYIERANLTLRMSQRRFTRLTNAFSKKYANLVAAVHLHAAHYNFCRKHMSLGGKTPAMAAGLADHAWTVAELVGLLEESERDAIASGALKRGKYGPRNRG
jgi:IS1 family transposase